MCVNLVEHPDTGRQPIVSVHVCDFPSALMSSRWVASASRILDSTQGSRLAKTMMCFGTHGSSGFSPWGIPHLARVITLFVWDEESALDAFLRDSPLAHEWETCRWAWYVRAMPLQSRGTFKGLSPLADVPRSAPNQMATTSGPIAVLTLGRTSWRTTSAFTRITPEAKSFLRTPGLITAVSAGLPVNGNCTFTLWESEADMKRFAYGESLADHRETIKQSHRRSVLVEQLSGRFRPVRIEGSWDPNSTPNSSMLADLASMLKHQLTVE